MKKGKLLMCCAIAIALISATACSSTKSEEVPAETEIKLGISEK